MTMITPSYLGETIEYSSLHACRSTLEDPTLRRPRPAPRRSGRAQQFGPALFDQPANHRLGKGVAQSLRSRERVDHVSHRTQADNQQTVDLRAAFCRHDQDFLGESRERRISLVE